MLQVEQNNETTRLNLKGPLTIYEVAELHRKLLELLADPGPLQLDLSAVSECDSAGLQLLLVIKKSCRRRNRALTVYALGEAVLGQAQLLGFDLPAALEVLEPDPHGGLQGEGEGDGLLGPVDSGRGASSPGAEASVDYSVEGS